MPWKRLRRIFRHPARPSRIGRRWNRRRNGKRRTRRRRPVRTGARRRRPRWGTKEGAPQRRAVDSCLRSRLGLAGLPGPVEDGLRLSRREKEGYSATPCFDFLSGDWYHRPMEITAKIRDTVSAVAQRHGVALVLVFGSFP